jgi:hypothetical protein
MPQKAAGLNREIKLELKSLVALGKSFFIPEIDNFLGHLTAEAGHCMQRSEMHSFFVIYSFTAMKRRPEDLAARRVTQFYLQNQLGVDCQNGFNGALHFSNL